MKLRLTDKTTIQQIEQWASEPKRECVFAISTPWWSLFDDAWMPYSKSRLPCDPRGSMLMQGELSKFWESALANPQHYGKHGIGALVAAFHGNVEVLTADGRGWRPTSLSNWDAYNALLDEALDVELR